MARLAYRILMACTIWLAAVGNPGGGAGTMTEDGKLGDALRRHVGKLTVEIGERTVQRPPGLALAAAYIQDVFERAGLEVRRQAYDYHGQQVANLIATPSGGIDPDYYLVGAHYDTVPGTPGADDNASAVAVLLELGRWLGAHPQAPPIRLVAFTLEEAPAYNTALQGSRVFVRELTEAGERVLGAVILEMVGYTSPRQHYPLVLRWAGYPRQGNFIGVVGNWRSRRFGNAILRGFRRNPRLPVESLFVPFDGWVLPATRLSDHASFWDRGWPAVMVTDTAFFRNPNYHTKLDRLETLDFGFMAELVGSLALALDELIAVE